MATLTRRIARCSTTFFRAASKAYMVTAWCGLVLMSAVAAHAGTYNGLPVNGISFNGISLNGITLNGITTNGIATNGININGITANGINFNGMPYNGLTVNALTLNGMPRNGLPRNGMPFNGCPMDELFLQGTAAHGANYSSESSPRVPNESLPWATLSHQGLGKSSH